MTISTLEITVSGLGIEGRTVAIIPNSWEYDEGTPEKKVRATIVGDTVIQDFSEDYENAFSSYKFSLPSTVINLDLTRTWEKAKNNLLVTVIGTETIRGIVQTFRRSFKNASVDKMNKPTGSDAVLEVSGMADAAT